MIKLDKELSPAKRDSILEMYRNMITDVEVDQLGYVKNKILQKIAFLQNSDSEMERYLAAYARIIYELLIYETSGEIVEDYHKSMLSALYYLCDPVDYIPDRHPENAHLDDAMVINQCLSILKEQSRETYKHISNYIRDSNI